MKKAFVIWVREVKLSEFLAREIGADLVISYIPKRGNFKNPILFRYIDQAIDTWKKLRKIKPDVIFVQSPPIFAVLVVYWYSKLYKTSYIIDTHTAGFIDKKWKFFHFLSRFFAKRALLNTVHNYKNQEFLDLWGIKNSYVLQFYNPKKEELLGEEEVELPIRLKNKLKSQMDFKVFMVNRFANDDAHREVFQLAAKMPEALFFVTGDAGKLDYETKIKLPKNIVLTGYLKHKEFIKLMEKSDIVLALTKRKDTVLWSIREILALQKPFVTSDSEVLRHYFDSIATFTDHTPLDMEEKIKEVWKNRFEIKGRIEMFLEKDKERWKKDMAYLQKIIADDQNTEAKRSK
ncbi:MAG TPA: hypothetical protein PLK35_03740 [Candidatus Moranbacteria bacterium]|nr:hypothetical protein [Candidatus Moranbacteria bacterium]